MTVDEVHPRRQGAPGLHGPRRAGAPRGHPHPGHRIPPAARPLPGGVPPRERRGGRADRPVLLPRRRAVRPPQRDRRPRRLGGDGAEPPAPSWRAGPRETSSPSCGARWTSTARRPSPGLPPFTGGAVGYIGYDAVRYLERIPNRHPRRDDLPDAAFHFYDSVVAFDRARHRLVLIAQVKVPAAGGAPLDLLYRDARNRLDRLEEALLRPAPGEESAGRIEPLEPSSILDGMQSDCTREAYQESVLRAKGTSPRATPSRWSSPSVPPADRRRPLPGLPGAPRAQPLALPLLPHLGRHRPPGLLARDPGEGRGAPGGVRPIAGTRRRRATAAEDGRLEEELLADEKELAEHRMLVDLGRNDVGRVARFGTVRVPRLLEVEHYSHVMHIVSQVEGELRPGLTALDGFAPASPPAPSPGRPRSGPWRSSTSWSHARRGSTPAPSATWTSPATSTPASPSARSSSTAARRAAGGRGHRGRLRSRPRVPGDHPQGLGALRGDPPGRGAVRLPGEGPRGRGRAAGGGGAMILVIDNYDSFTFNLVQFVGELGAEPRVYRNDALDGGGGGGPPAPRGLISPGPGMPQDAGVSIDLLRGLPPDVPVLGVCLGHQAIGPPSAAPWGALPPGPREDGRRPARRERPLPRSPEPLPGRTLPLAGGGARGPPRMPGGLRLDGRGRPHHGPPPPRPAGPRGPVPPRVDPHR